MSGFAKLFFATGALLVGLQLYGKWTGSSFNLDLTGLNDLGKAINAARATGKGGDVAPATGVGGGAGPDALALRSAMIDSGTQPWGAVHAASQILPGSAYVLVPN